MNSLKTLNLHINSVKELSPFSVLDIKFLDGNLTTNLHIEKHQYLSFTIFDPGKGK